MLEHEGQGSERPERLCRRHPELVVARRPHDPYELVSLPRLVGLDRADRARARRDLDALVLGDLQQEVGRVRGAYLADDLDDAARVISQEQASMRDHVLGRQGAEPSSERGAHRAVLLGERGEDALVHVTASLRGEGARREAGGDAKVGVLVACEAAQRAEHVGVTDLGEVADGSLEHLARRIVREHVERRGLSGTRANLGQRRERRRRRYRLVTDERHETRRRALGAHSAERGDRREPQREARVGRQEARRDRLLERRKPEPARGRDRGRRDRLVAVEEPAVHVGHEPDVAEPAPHRVEQADALRGGVRLARDGEQRECGALGDLPLRVEGTPRDRAENAARIEAQHERGRVVRVGLERSERIGGRQPLVLERTLDRAAVLVHVAVERIAGERHLRRWDDMPIVAITHMPSPRMNDAVRTFIDVHAIDLDLAALQHEEYRRVLERAGAEVVLLDANLDHADAVFVEDTAVVLDEVAILTSMGAPSRREEPRGIEPELARHRGTIARLEAPATLEGGDVLRVGRTLFVGATARTNAAGVTALRTIAGPLGYTVRAVRRRRMPSSEDRLHRAPRRHAARQSAMARRARPRGVRRASCRRGRARCGERGPRGWSSPDGSCPSSDDRPHSRARLRGRRDRPLRVREGRGLCHVPLDPGAEHQDRRLRAVSPQAAFSARGERRCRGPWPRTRRGRPA